MAAVSERLPNIDFVMSIGFLRIPSRPSIGPFAMLRTRKPILVIRGAALAGADRAAAVAGAADSFGVYAMPTPPPCTTSRAWRGSSRAPSRHPAGVRPAPSFGATAPASVLGTIVIGNSWRPVRGHQSESRALFVCGCGSADEHGQFSDTYNPPDSSGHQAEPDLARWYGLPSLPTLTT
jgi:hypothetical protein